MAEGSVPQTRQYCGLCPHEHERRGPSPSAFAYCLLLYFFHALFSLPVHTTPHHTTPHHTTQDFHKSLKVPHADPTAQEFLKRCTYFAGAYDKVETFVALHHKLQALERASLPALASLPATAAVPANRAFYLAIPPSLFAASSKSLKAGAMSTTGWNRIVVEKPFGKDSESSAELSKVTRTRSGVGGGRAALDLRFVWCADSVGSVHRRPDLPHRPLPRQSMEHC